MSKSIMEFETIPKAYLPIYPYIQIWGRRGILLIVLSVIRSFMKGSFVTKDPVLMATSCYESSQDY